MVDVTHLGTLEGAKPLGILGDVAVAKQGLEDTVELGLVDVAHLGTLAGAKSLGILAGAKSWRDL